MLSIVNIYIYKWTKDNTMQWTKDNTRRGEKKREKLNSINSVNLIGKHN